MNHPSEPRETWRTCTSCRLPIGFEVPHFRCSISTCNRKRTFLVFCSLPCWEAHREETNHRDGWAVTATSPTPELWRAEVGQDRARLAEKGRRADATAPETLAAKMDAQAGVKKGPREPLIVVTRFKDYVANKAPMSVSDGVFPVLSDHVREIVNRAAVLSVSHGRKTLLDRDVLPLIQPKLSARLHAGSPAAKSPEEILLVVSKFKHYVKAAHGMNTSDGVALPLSDHLRRIATESIRNAGRDERKTLLGRDVQLAVEEHLRERPALG